MASAPLFTHLGVIRRELEEGEDDELLTNPLLVQFTHIPSPGEEEKRVIPPSHLLYSFEEYAYLIEGVLVLPSSEDQSDFLIL